MGLAQKLVPIFLLVACVGVAQGAVMTSKDYPLGQRSLFSDRAITERVKPTAQVCVEGDACAAEVTTVVASAGTAAGPKTPESIYNGTCKTCHGSGIAGAPKVGTADWKPRAAKGVDTLVKHAISGFNAMPPKGTCATCSDADIRGVVKYMLDHSK